MYQVADLREHEKLKDHFYKLKFARKKLKNIVQEAEQNFKSLHEEVWEEVYDYIEENGLVRDGFKRGQHELEFNQEDDVLMCMGDKSEECNGMEMLRRLLT